MLVGGGWWRTSPEKWKRKKECSRIRRIHVAMKLAAPESARETVERVHGMYGMRCPLYRTLHKAIQLTSSYELVDQGQNAQQARTGRSD